MKTIDDEKVKEIRRMSRKNHMYVMLLCVSCILMNLILSKLVAVLKLPIWFDTAGTMLSAILGGYLPGIVVGFLTNIFKGSMDLTSIYYGVLNVIIAVAAVFFANRGFLKKFWKTVVFIIVMTLIGGGIGGLLPWLLSGFPSAGFWNDLFYDLIDKSITVIIVLLVLKLIPNKIKELVYFYGWKQTPLSQEEIKKVKKIRCRETFLRRKIQYILIIALVFLSVIATGISFMLYRNSIVEEYAGVAYNVANQAASHIDGNKVDDYITKGYATFGYNLVEKELEMIRDSAPDIKFIYVYRMEPEGCRVVFDLDTEEFKGEEPGTLVPFDESFDPYIDTLLEGGEIEPIITNDTYGYLLTAYVPVYDDAGECTCYVGADIEMAILATSQISFFTQMVFLFMGFVILILAIVVWFIDYDIIFPINSMTLRSGEFAYNSEEALEENVENIRNLDIHTGDEVESLYLAFLKMTEDSMGYMEEIKEKTETITKMQGALIMVLADMVENRDENTGQHIHKTAAYVEIILKKMRSMGLHKDILTDEYISNVVLSAPLHDIGKIQVSDLVLRKPGKLNDEEYEKMKTHTTAGMVVIDRVIKQVPDSGYLYEARDLAHYHHEKWDGSGYPEGISGEDIPLSARVMAVADVFDALVSERVYKKGFSIEKSLEIIKKDAGTHFDPQVVEAFLAAEDEVREVERRFKEEGSKEQEQN
ncbi:MAG: HD domain-containing protein [Lachnospiraceae bacterium]|nr:HD domain-containing protein [Lachnospiraceae bacterium]